MTLLRRRLLPKSVKRSIGPSAAASNNNNDNTSLWWLMCRSSGNCCCSILQYITQCVVVLIWGLSLGVHVAVVQHVRTMENANQPSMKEIDIGGRPRTIPLGTDGLPSLAALLKQQQKQQQQQKKASIRGSITVGDIPNQQKHHHPNPNNCHLPPKSQIITVSVPAVMDNNQTFFELAIWDDGDFLSSQLSTKGWWEITGLDEMAALAPTGLLPDSTTGTFYDIGANVGYYTFLFAANGYTVVAIEPDPSNVALLLASKCLNPTLPVYVVETAVTNPTELATSQSCRLWAHVNARTEKYLHSIPRLECPTPSTICNPNYDKVCVENVPIATLAQIVHQIKEQHQLAAPNIIKVDVEGHEFQVLENALTLNPMPHTIQFENKDGRVREKIESMLQHAGYTIGTKHGHDYNTVAQMIKNTS